MPVASLASAAVACASVRLTAEGRCGTIALLFTRSYRMGFFEENRRRKNAERYERAERLERLKDQFGKVKDSYRNLSDEEKVALPGVVSELSPQRVMTVGSVIVTYRLNAADPL